MSLASRLNSSKTKIAVDLALFLASQIAFYYAFKYVMAGIDPTRQKRDEAKVKSKKALGRLGIADLDLSEHEAIIAAEVIHPSDINAKFEDVGGMEPIIDQLRETVIYPLCFPHLFDSAAGLYAAPKGVLLYGPPGCGKTLLAKALARESSATFINMKASVLQDKWFGESNKLVAALFSLARKLQPTIIFIDEIDSFMRERSINDHEASGMVKAEFMSSWDGLLTGDDTRILVLGATNRPNDIDSAILRRMPKRFAVRLPDLFQRKSILSLMLRDISLTPEFDIDILARRSDGLSGSDLKELCRNAASRPIREQMRKLQGKSVTELQELKSTGFSARPLRMEDFFSDDLARSQSTIDEMLD